MWDSDNFEFSVWIAKLAKAIPTWTLFAWKVLRVLRFVLVSARVAYLLIRDGSYLRNRRTLRCWKWKWRIRKTPSGDHSYFGQAWKRLGAVTKICNFQTFVTENYLRWLVSVCHLLISLLRSVTVPEPLRSTVMSADVSLRFRILDMKSGSMGGGPATEAVEVSFLLRPPKVRPKSARVPRRFKSEFCPTWQIYLYSNIVFHNEKLPFSLYLSLSRIPQSLRSSVSWANDDLRLLEVVWDELDKSSTASMVVIWLQEFRRPFVFPRRPRIMS